MLTDTVKASQAAYAARPYAARLITSHYSGELRFATLQEALSYLRHQYAQGAEKVRREKHRSFDAHRSYITLPCGTIIRCDEFIGPSLDSY